MNTDIRLATGFWQHPKTGKTLKRLGLEGVRSLQILWAWAALNRPDGNLSGMDAEDIELAADWHGADGEFVRHCAGLWLDGEEGSFALHQWLEHNPWAADAEKRQDEARFGAFKRWNPALARQMEERGIRSISKVDYARLRDASSLPPDLADAPGLMDAPELADLSSLPKPPQPEYQNKSPDLSDTIIMDSGSGPDWPDWPDWSDAPPAPDAPLMPPHRDPIGYRNAPSPSPAPAQAKKKGGGARAEVSPQVMGGVESERATGGAAASVAAASARQSAKLSAAAPAQDPNPATAQGSGQKPAAGKGGASAVTAATTPALASPAAPGSASTPSPAPSPALVPELLPASASIPAAVPASISASAWAGQAAGGAAANFAAASPPSAYPAALPAFGSAPASPGYPSALPAFSPSGPPGYPVSYPASPGRSSGVLGAKSGPLWPAFLSCYSIYPVRQGQEAAWQEWQRLHREGALPPVWEIRDAILLMAAEDERWQRGKVPALAKWLNGKRWNDEPYRAKRKGPAVGSAGGPAGGSARSSPRASTQGQAHQQERDLMAEMILARREQKQQEKKHA